MTQREILDLLEGVLARLTGTDVGVLQIEDEGSGLKLRVERGARTAAPPPKPEATDAPAVPAGRPAAANPGAARASEPTEIRAPIVGTFYAAPAPDAPPFVTVGQVVSKGDTLCIIEAMKMMNEIEAERDGVVARVLAQNGCLVEFGQLLFELEEA
ncbi:MAG: acetyl-CoA carboxylase biotin carboxyl carrier protein [Oscillospiraceae bacterium]|jgi:acetyl-CoA carboxylase biotin carboxyl carrier protein|nr:acetyl-CoA carboxylase biotin carboxyl carrier protein [Oscillospiraceae bacterium]